jgi:hypothetical protein
MKYFIKNLFQRAKSIFTTKNIFIVLIIFVFIWVGIRPVVTRSYCQKTSHRDAISVMKKRVEFYRSTYKYTQADELDKLISAGLVLKETKDDMYVYCLKKFGMKN